MTSAGGAVGTREPGARLVGMGRGPATVENTTEVSQERQNRTTLRPSNSTLGTSPQEMKTPSREETHTLTSTAALTTAAKTSQQPTRPLRDEWIMKLWVEYSATINRRRSCHLPQRGRTPRALC